MKYENQLLKYAELTVKCGVNVQPGQFVTITSPICASDFAVMVQKAAFEAGARDVLILYGDDRATKNRLTYVTKEVVEDIPEWRVLQRTVYAREGGAVINIIAEDPEALVGVSPEKLMAQAIASHKAFDEFYKLMDKGIVPWTIVAYPCVPWARKVFPGVSDAVAMDKLFNAIFKTVRIGRGDSVKKWKSHDRTLKRRAKILNESKFDALRFENSLGTNITVGLVKNHIWQGGSDKTPDKNKYFPNMPTEEIFSMPDRTRINGKVVASMPLSYRGSLVDKFSITFENGNAVDYSAEVGYETLKRIIDTDEGSKSLGEVALIPHDSPISNLGILFYNTLFDENASCHLALGSCYPSNTKGGEKMTREELKAHGGNDSAVHVDFMFGTSDMKVTGILPDGTEVPVFENGSFVF